MASILLLGLQNRKKEKRDGAVTEIVPKTRIFCEPASVGSNNFLATHRQIKNLAQRKQRREENGRVKMRRERKLRKINIIELKREKFSPDVILRCGFSMNSLSFTI